jgi:hypothetical protein
MMTPLGRCEPRVLPAARADGGVTTLEERLDVERLDVMGSNLVRSRLRLVNGTTFAKLGAACAARVPTVAVSGWLPIEMLLSGPEGLGSSTRQAQYDSLGVRMTLAVLALNYDMDRVRSFFAPASCRHAI